MSTTAAFLHWSPFKVLPWHWTRPAMPAWNGVPVRSGCGKLSLMTRRMAGVKGRACDIGVEGRLAVVIGNEMFCCEKKISLISLSSADMALTWARVAGVDVIVLFGFHIWRFSCCFLGSWTNGVIDLCLNAAISSSSSLLSLSFCCRFCFLSCLLIVKNFGHVNLNWICLM